MHCFNGPNYVDYKSKTSTPKFWIEGTRIFGDILKVSLKVKKCK